MQKRERACVRRNLKIYLTGALRSECVQPESTWFWSGQDGEQAGVHLLQHQSQQKKKKKRRRKNQMFSSRDITTRKSIFWEIFTKTNKGIKRQSESKLNSLNRHSHNGCAFRRKSNKHRKTNLIYLLIGHKFSCLWPLSRSCTLLWKQTPEGRIARNSQGF